MGVEQIYNYLKNHKGFHSARDIYKALKLNQKSVSKSLNAIATFDDVVCEYAHIIRGKAHKSVGLKARKAWVYAHVSQIKGGDKIGRNTRS